MSNILRAASIALCFHVNVAEAKGQLQLASVVAIVLDPQSRPIAGAVITLRDPLGAELQRAATDAGGRVTFTSVAPGRYALHTAAAGAASFDLPVTVSGALPIEMIVRVPSAVTDIVTVEGGTREQPSARRSIAGESLAQVPVRARSRALQDVVATLPGWTTEDNGLLHARGVDDGFLYVIDGVPVYERLDAVSGIAPDLASVASVSVITGYVPPEFGHKAGGVIEIRSSSAATRWNATADLSTGSDATRDGSLTAGGRLGARAGVRAGASATRSDRFLDPVHPDNLHNSGGQSSAFGQFDLAAGARDRVTAGWGLGRSLFDVPNTARQHEAGQDQRQRIGQRFLNATWQRTWSPLTVTHAAAYHRRTEARLDGSALDTPLIAHADRDLARSGVLVATTRQQGAHLVKIGVEWQRVSIAEQFEFAVSNLADAEVAELRDEALVFTPQHPFRFSGAAARALWSVYAQDVWHASSQLTLSGGVRFDRSALLLARSQWSPRLGAALSLGPATVARLAVSRFFQPPQPENLLLSSSPEARVLTSIRVDDDDGGADLEPERQWGTEFGLAQQLGRRARVDVAYWHRRIENAADPNVFAGTTLIFPNAVASGRAHGVEMRFELPEHQGWSAYASWSAARVVQTGPVTGGLFLEDEVESLGPGVEFTPDHDQRFTAGSGVTWTHAYSGLALSATARYETGTPVQREDDDELRALPGAERVDFDAARVRPRMLLSLRATLPLVRSGTARASAGVQVLNLLDARYAYNFGNPFSGTHFGAPRSLAVTLRVTFQ
jgi:outer membrane receptor for ferrienterochelin and colicin